MVDGEYFKKLEAVARSVKGNDQPFGGIQLILTGDFLQVWTLKTVLFWETKYIAFLITIQNMQLPPVTKEAKSRRFAFETSAWGRCNLLLIHFFNFCKVQPSQHQPHSSQEAE